MEFTLLYVLFVQRCFWQPSLSRTCHYKGKSVWEYIGTSYGTVSGSVVCPLTIKTTGIYSLIFIICARVFLQPSLSSTCHYKGKSIGECIGTSCSTFSDSIIYPFCLKTTEIYSLTFYHLWKIFFCNLHFPVLATLGENLFKNK